MATIIVFLIFDPIRVIVGLIVGFISPFALWYSPYDWSYQKREGFSFRQFGIVFLGASFSVMIFWEVVIAVINFFKGLS